MNIASLKFVHGCSGFEWTATSKWPLDAEKLRLLSPILFLPLWLPTGSLTHEFLLPWTILTCGSFPSSNSTFRIQAIDVRERKRKRKKKNIVRIMNLSSIASKTSTCTTHSSLQKLPLVRELGSYSRYDASWAVQWVVVVKTPVSFTPQSVRGQTAFHHTELDVNKLGINTVCVGISSGGNLNGSHWDPKMNPKLCRG